MLFRFTSQQELNLLFTELNDMVVAQEQLIDTIEKHTDRVVENTRTGNLELDKGIQSARSWRKVRGFNARRHYLLGELCSLTPRFHLVGEMGLFFYQPDYPHYRRPHHPLAITCV